MQYHFKTEAVNAIATTAPPRVVDAHGLLHLRASKSAKACLAADLVDGLAVLQNPTQRVAAAAYGVSSAPWPAPCGSPRSSGRPYGRVSGRWSCRALRRLRRCRQCHRSRRSRR